MKTYILGHLKPDTDAVVAALALEFLYTNSPALATAFPGATAAITGPINPETAFLFEKFGITTPPIIGATDLAPEDRVILVDHNEADQRLEGLNPEQIIAIVDHHKIKLDLPNPIEVTFKPWGSSSTIAYWLMKSNNVTPSAQIATLMLAAILSDTVGYKSATTTPQDPEFGRELATIAGVEDVAALTLEIFKAKSDVSKLTDEQIVTNDYKVFDFGGKKVLIDQLETVEQDLVLTSKKAGLLTAMAAIKAKEGVDYIFVAITDILAVNTKVLVLDDESAAIASRAFGGAVTDQILDIGPKMSRKKEIAPAIEKALT